MEIFLHICDWIAYSSGMIGAPLGFLDYFYPKQANRLEDWIDDLQFKLERWGGEWTKGKFFELLLFLIIPFFFFAIYYPIGYYSPRIDFPELPAWVWIVYLILNVPVLGALSLYFGAHIIEVLNKLTNGHALGSLGLILIIVGAITDTLDKILSIWY